MKGAKLMMIFQIQLQWQMSGTKSCESAVFMAIAKIILEEKLYDREYLENWVNWDEYLKKLHPDDPIEFDQFIIRLDEEWSSYTPEYAAQEAQIDEKQIRRVAKIIANAGSRLATFSIGYLGGWQVARALHLLNVLTGSVGTEGGTSPSAWNKFHPEFFDFW